MFDFSAERTLQSVDESLRRLGLDYIDVIQVILKKPFMKDDVASQHHNFGWLYFSWELQIAFYIFLTFPYHVLVPKNCGIFIGCNFELHVSNIEEPKEQGRVTITRGTTHKKMTTKERIRTLKTRGITKCIESDYKLENHNNNYETYVQTTCGRTRVPRENKRNPRFN